MLLQPLQPAAAAGSGFIDNMPPLSQDAGRGGAELWTKPDLDRAAYPQMMVAPITIFISPDSKYKGLDVDQLKALADGFRDVVTLKLAPEIAVVDKPGPGVMYARAAISNVRVEKAKRGLLGYTPAGFVLKAAKDAVVGPSLTLKDAVLEIEMLDSVTGERLGVLVDKAPKAADDDLSWDSINNTFAYYAERFKGRMLAAKNTR
jgi:hypothetical protein